ncbi:MAG: GNAT family N-acetyltransferase [Planctomycetota bacterium]|jgi:GNAT superfamily N-acetyltransferase
MREERTVPDAVIRPATDADAAGIVDVIEGVYREHGDVLDLAGYDRDLTTIEDTYAGRGGAFVVLEIGGRVCGTHAVLPLDAAAGVATFRRLYLDRTYRGRGHGAALMQWTLRWARRHGFRRVEFWSDVRFGPAHRFFESFGFRRGRVRRATPENPYDEHAFVLDLG